MKPLNMKRKILSAAIAAMAGTLSTGMVLAQDDSVEEVVVTGIRGSLVQSMDMKRDASGVVDAISAEDIGKMPDSNLAESLQRITGVSIDRQNGEGSRVTVRGFGPDYNIVTLNGRQMPAANINATTASNSRSYDFGNLAAESVAGVEVYKTGKANLNTGGIGSLINIKTARPFDVNEPLASVGVKAVNDTTNRVDSDITPEISGIFSNTFADDTIGVALSGSYQERNSGYNSAETSSGWYTIKGNDGDWGSLPAGDAFENRPQENDVYSVPRNLLYSINDIQRKRTNAQLTLQWAPTDTVTTTLDYTYAEQDVEQHRQELSAWFNGVPTTGKFTEGTNTAGSVVGPIIYSDGTGNDIGMGVGDWGTTNENNSLGLNVEWSTTDNLKFVFDYHDSDAETGAKDDRGSNNVVTVQQKTRASATVDYSKEFPAMDIFHTPGVNGLDPALFLDSGTSFRNSYMKSEIEQAQISGEYSFDDNLIKSINFGISMTENKNRSAFSNAQRDTWGGVFTPAEFDEALFTRKDLSSEFSGLSGSNNPMLEPDYYAVDFDGLIARMGELGVALAATPEFSTDRRALEEQAAAYAQVNMGWDFGTMPANLAVGVRYEETDVTADALVPAYSSLVWAADNEFTAISNGSDFTSLKGAYENWLPNVDFDIALMDDLIVRASSSVTIARPSYSDIQGGVTINQPIRFNGGTGNSGNPDLDPFESTNIDLSTEWYYDEGSYISLGYYKKDVKNFIGQDSTNSTIFELAHPAQGDRYDAAVAATGSNDPAIVRAYMESLYGAPVAGDASQGDPSTVFNLIAPVNQKEASIDGWEFAVQHLFGESGFGGIINFTTVEGDIEYDNYNTNKGEGVVNQFALLGLSDSANLVGFYDKDGLQIRVAYNWRDEFLTSTLDGNGERNPIYTEAYGQMDINVSYQLTDNFSIFAEGINVTDENARLHGRHENMVVAAIQQGARYNVGARYKF